MLSKLIKYEFKSTARYLLPLFGGILFLAIINKLLMSFFSLDSLQNIDNDIVYFLEGVLLFIGFSIYIIVIVATTIMTTFLVVRRFQQNLFTDEGYLSFTLPVTANQHLSSKLITGSIWMLAGGLIILLSLFILSIGEWWAWFAREMMNVIQTIPATYSVSLGIFGFEIMIIMLICIPASLLKFYLCVTFAYTRRNHKLLYGLAAYLVLNFAEQLISFLVSCIINLFYSMDTTTYMDAYAFSDFFFLGSYVHVTMLISLLITVAFSALYYYLIHMVLSKRLNLE